MERERHATDQREGVESQATEQLNLTALMSNQPSDGVPDFMVGFNLSKHLPTSGVSGGCRIDVSRAEDTEEEECKLIRGSTECLTAGAWECPSHSLVLLPDYDDVVIAAAREVVAVRAPPDAEDDACGDGDEGGHEAKANQRKEER